MDPLLKATLMGRGLSPSVQPKPTPPKKPMVVPLPGLKTRKGLDEPTQFKGKGKGKGNVA